MLTIHQGNNLDTLQRLADEGQRFDLIELDGPYGAGLEGWDILTEAEYVQHYAERLSLVRQVLQPWGVCYLFGYPEMVALVRAWAQQMGTLHLRRWINWYKQVTAHKGRKVEAIALFVQSPASNLLSEFKTLLTARRKAMGLNVGQAMALTPCRKHLAGKGAGMMWFEAESSDVPTAHEYLELKRIFDIPDYFDQLCTLGSYDGVTNIDFIGRHYSEDTRDLNDNGLRSKPVGLYLDLLRPVVPPRPEKRALILYGGSGNAGIAAGRLGYRVDICETDASRCALIQRRYAWGVERRDETPTSELGPLFNQEAA
jgi:DNA modification methylase